jgi:hypothetical protein
MESLANFYKLIVLNFVKNASKNCKNSRSVVIFSLASVVVEF